MNYRLAKVMVLLYTVGCEFATVIAEYLRIVGKNNGKY